MLATSQLNCNQLNCNLMKCPRPLTAAEIQMQSRLKRPSSKKLEKWSKLPTFHCEKHRIAPIDALPNTVCPVFSTIQAGYVALRPWKAGSFDHFCQFISLATYLKLCNLTRLIAVAIWTYTVLIWAGVQGQCCWFYFFVGHTQSWSGRMFRGVQIKNSTNILKSGVKAAQLPNVALQYWRNRNEGCTAAKSRNQNEGCAAAKSGKRSEGCEAPERSFPDFERTLLNRASGVFAAFYATLQICPVRIHIGFHFFQNVRILRLE